jgi:outer membrane translocation and assembly module TamA
VGIDFRTPIGPLRVGYAHNIAHLTPGEPKGLFHFGIGYPW